MAALFVISSFSHAADKEITFTPQQMEVLHYAYQFGEQFTKQGEQKDDANRYDGKGLGYIFAALVWQESSAGTVTKGKDGHAAYGIFQNYLPTLRNRMAQNNVNMSDREIIRHVGLRENSATWAYEELNYWLHVHKGDTRKAIASYNAGWKWKSHGLKYANQVLWKANYLKANHQFKQLE